jgi:hypothetical protein
VRWIKANNIVSSLVAVAVAAGHLVAADTARAETALFRASVDWIDAVSTYTGALYPTTMASSKGAYVGPTGPVTPVGRVVLPRSWYDFSGTWYWPKGHIQKGIAVSGGFYDMANGQVRLWPNNPYGPTMDTTTVVFPTTDGNNLPFSHPPGSTGTVLSPNTGGGLPDVLLTCDPPYSACTDCGTCTWGGRYDFSRAGSIQIQRGANRFGGTMKWIYGPDSFFYQLWTAMAYPYISRAWGSFTSNTPYDESEVGELDTTGMVTRYRYTSGGVSKVYTLGGSPIKAVAHYIHTFAPWTTGRVEGYQPLGDYLTRLTDTGFDNRTAMGLSGTLSLVRPRLVQVFTNHTVDGIHKGNEEFEIWRLNVVFSPEPGRILLLGAGIVMLAGLLRLWRR